MRTNTILVIVSLLSLVALMLPSILFLAGRMELTTAKWVMLAATGSDFFDVQKSIGLFHIANNENDMVGAMVNNSGLSIYTGNLSSTLYSNTIVGLNDVYALNNRIHMAFVFSNDGLISDDGSSVRVYINNVLEGKFSTKWEVSDNKYFRIIFGGYGILPVVGTGVISQPTSLNAIISGLKIYNYCKQDFSDTLNGVQSGLITPTRTCDLIEISKDNLTFYKAGAVELPLSYGLVAPGASESVFVRTTIPRDISSTNNRTSGIIMQWDMGV